MRKYKRSISAPTTSQKRSRICTDAVASDAKWPGQGAVVQSCDISRRHMGAARRWRAQLCTRGRRTSPPLRRASPVTVRDAVLPAGVVLHAVEAMSSSGRQFLLGRDRMASRDRGLALGRADGAGPAATSSTEEGRRCDAPRRAETDVHATSASPARFAPTQRFDAPRATAQRCLKAQDAA